MCGGLEMKSRVLEEKKAAGLGGPAATGSIPGGSRQPGSFIKLNYSPYRPVGENGFARPQLNSWVRKRLLSYEARKQFSLWAGFPSTGTHPIALFKRLNAEGALKRLVLGPLLVT